MRNFLLVVAVLLTGALWPATFTIGAHNGRDGQPAALLLVTLCLIRGLVLTGAGVGFWWAVMVEVACVGLLVSSIDQDVLMAWRVIAGVLAFVGPLVVVVGSWMGKRNLVLGMVGVLVLTRAVGWSCYWPLTEKSRMEKMSSGKS